jgi:transcription elongation factor Elf1
MIDENEFRLFVNDGWTVKDLQEFYGLSRSGVYSYKKKWDLVGKSPNITQKATVSDDTKHCSDCNKIKSVNDFYSNGYQPNGKKKYKSKCKECDQTYRYNSFNTKLEIILQELNREYKCERCGYNKNSAAIHFHHLDPNDKDLEVSSISRTLSIDSMRDLLAKEIEKCAILCSNCHMEEHYPHLNKE